MGRAGCEGPICARLRISGVFGLNPPRSGGNFGALGRVGTVPPGRGRSRAVCEGGRCRLDCLLSEATSGNRRALCAIVHGCV